MATVLPNALEFLESSQLADFTVKCEEFKWKVHHIILASGSKFFDKACSSNFREAADKMIILHDEKPEMVARMLLCLYTSSYPDLFFNSWSGSPNLRRFLIKGHPTSEVDQFEYEDNALMVHSEMYAMAEKYDMPGLQAVCVGKFVFVNDPYPEEHELRNLVKALPHVYTSTPPSSTALRLKAAALVHGAYSRIMHEPKLKTQLGSACIENGQLGWDVLSNLFNRQILQCVDCDDIDCEPFDDEHRFRNEGGICVCGLTKLCGSFTCSRLMEEKWLCPDCTRSNVPGMPGKMRVKEKSNHD